MKTSRGVFKVLFGHRVQSLLLPLQLLFHAVVNAVFSSNLEMVNSMKQQKVESKPPSEKVHLRREGKVAVLELDNPNGGYLTAHLQREINRLTSELEADPEVRVIVLTGKAPGTFVTHYSPFELVGISSTVKGISSDAALRKVRKQSVFVTRLIYGCQRYPSLFRWLDKRAQGSSLESLFLGARINGMQSRWQRSSTVYIAAINGYSMGGGCEMAMACDFRLMARGEGVIGLPESISGIIPGSGGTQRMARLLGAGRAVEMIITGTLLSADEAADIGLVSRAVDADKLMDETMALAVQMAGQPPLSIQGVKRAVHTGVNMPLDRGIALEATHFFAAIISRDAAALGDRYLDRLEQETDAKAGIPAEAGSIAKRTFDEFRKGNAVEICGN
jgi:enoyl-CoA hydratase/carnithine racemase